MRVDHQAKQDIFYLVMMRAPLNTSSDCEFCQSSAKRESKNAEHTVDLLEPEINQTNNLLILETLKYE